LELDWPMLVEGSVSGVRSRPFSHFRMPHPTELSPGDSGSEQSLADALAAFDQVQRDLAAMRWSVARAIEQAINRFAGHSWGSQNANKAVVSRINELLRGHALRLICPSCSAPSVLFLQTTGERRPRHGSFQFQHSLGIGRDTRHSGSKVMPEVSVVPLIP
jgi:hypothetical protein